MSVQFFCPRWGSEDKSWTSFCARVKEAGYDGIEYAIAANVSKIELDAAWNTAEKYSLQMIAQHYDTVEPDFSKHFDLYHAWLEKIMPYPVVKINSQTGKDHFSFEQNSTLINLGITYGVVHETHRGKFSYAAHVTKEYLERMPDLQLTLDASHWVCVAESFLEDQSGAMHMAIDRTGHIHARIGYTQGPQVTDPRLPGSKEALEKHLNWWDKVIEKNASMTITPEFGPFPYMVQLPATGEPIACQWEINQWMMETLRKRYE